MRISEWARVGGFLIEREGEREREKLGDASLEVSREKERMRDREFWKVIFEQKNLNTHK
jgi:hypothetical protein